MSVKRKVIEEVVIPVAFDGLAALLLYFVVFWGLCYMRGDYTSIFSGGPSINVPIAMSTCAGYQIIRAQNIAYAVAGFFWMWLMRARNIAQSTKRSGDDDE